MTVEDIVRRRGITEILHFTTNLGLVGILDSRFLKSRQRIENDQRLEHIFSPNAAFREKDADWLDYVNLSISRVNSKFFAISKNHWHRDRDLWWCVLSFEPIILTHEGVYFTTTNNIYTGVQRGIGPAALEAMFAKNITRWTGYTVVRDPALPAQFPTCEQAEVLYPREVSSTCLQRVYVSRDEDADEVYGQVEALNHSKFPVTVFPKMFGLS
jgi:hypothetical protein